MTDAQLKVLYEQIIERVDIGIHAIDASGKTIIYNKKMRDLESMTAEDVLHKDLRDVFAFRENEHSTLLQSLQQQQQVRNVKQTYFNNRGVEITTVNQTFPVEAEDALIGAVELATDVTKMERLIRHKLAHTQTDYRFEHISGKSVSLQEAIDVAKRATRTQSNVLIIGETGTGKELFAQSIHAASARSVRPFVSQNCAAIPDSLIESILFGTTKGAFTGAVDAPGLFEQAQGGTLLLDELNSLNIHLQAKLLRVLQEKKVRRLGSTTEIPVDVRVIATMNEDPIDVIRAERLRKDLYYRLAVITVFIPPLRERTDDIPILIGEFLQKYNALFEMRVERISPDVLQFFMQHDWPGNVRELAHAIEASMNVMQHELEIEMHHLPYHYRKQQPVVQPTLRITSDSTLPLAEQLLQLERQVIIQALQQHEGHITNTAKQLGMSRQSLQYRMKRLNITTNGMK